MCVVYVIASSMATSVVVMRQRAEDVVSGLFAALAVMSELVFTCVCVGPLVCVYRFQELVQSTDVEELLSEAELARLRAELGQEGETPVAADVIEQVGHHNMIVWRAV